MRLPFDMAKSSSDEGKRNVVTDDETIFILSRVIVWCKAAAAPQDGHWSLWRSLALFLAAHAQ